MSTTPWGPIEQPAARGQERWFALLFPVGALVAAALLAVRGWLWLTLAVVVALAGVLQAKAVSPSFAARFERGLGRLAHAVGHGVGLVLSWVLLGLVFVVVVVPVWALGLPFRRRGLGRPRGVAGDGWIARTALAAPTRDRRTYATERGFASSGTGGAAGGAAGRPAVGGAPGDPAAGDGPAPAPVRARRRHPVLVGLGVVAVLVLADLALGAALAATGLRDGPRGDTRRYVEAAVTTTMAAPPIADEPWAPAYRDALIDYQLGGGTYTPFLVRAPRAFASEYLNTSDEERRSYGYEAPLPPGEQPLRVGFFGGSTMFGVGQRDEHTIPSEIARLAEEAGVPIEVHNYGLPGWVSWQELQYLERLLAAGEEYDLVVFYDGFNELLVQGTGYSADPTHLGADVMSGMAADYHDLHEVEPGLTDGLADLADTYRRNSGVALLLGKADPDPGAAQGGIQHAAATPEDQAAAALDVYGRATDLVRALAREHGTEARFFWQPQRSGWPPSITDHLPEGVIDVSHVLDGQEDDRYIDEVHTDEEGARLMAESIWAEIGPELAARASGAED